MIKSNLNQLGLVLSDAARRLRIVREHEVPSETRRETIDDDDDDSDDYYGVKYDNDLDSSDDW